MPVENKPDRAVAMSLMRMAIALLDRSDEGIAAARLQHALDLLEGEPVTPGDEAASASN